jgi:hypothetical protein
MTTGMAHERPSSRAYTAECRRTAVSDSGCILQLGHYGVYFSGITPDCDFS